MADFPAAAHLKHDTGIYIAFKDVPPNLLKTSAEVVIGDPISIKSNFQFLMFTECSTSNG